MVARTGGMYIRKNTKLDERRPQKIAGIVGVAGVNGAAVTLQYLESLQREREIRRRRFLTLRTARKRAQQILQEEQATLQELIQAGVPGVEEARQAVSDTEFNIEQLRLMEIRFIREDRHHYATTPRIYILRPR